MNRYLKSLWLTETVRLVEKESGQFNDEDANRQARTIDGSLSTRIIKRAELLSQQHNLTNIQNNWLASCKISITILGFVAIFIGAGLAFSALSQNPVNLLWALISLLGVHFLTLLLWLISFIFLPSSSNNILINLWLWLAKKLSHKQSTTQLLLAFIELFGKQVKWLVGLIVHFFWSIIMCSALVVLLVLFSAKYYSFAWQTTLLSADSIVSLTHLLGKIPAYIGFAMPDPSTIRSSEQALTEGDVRSVWAIWLLGVFVVYGVSVRIILLVICWFKWRTACQKITLNVERIEYQLLAQILQSQSIKSVIDPSLSFPQKIPNDTITRVDGIKNYLVALEVDPNWQPPEQVEFVGFLNSGEQRRQILDILQYYPAQKLLIAVDTDRSPDRGLINLIKLLQTKSVECRLWFINAGRQQNNWLDILALLNMEQSSSQWLVVDKEDNPR